MPKLFISGFIAVMILLPGALFADAPGETIARISAGFLGVRYQADTLGGGPGQTEVLIVNRAAVDCFTLLDYVEARRRASSPDEFRSRLKDVRYFNAQVSWPTRKHFFTDWAEDSWIVDVTAEIGGAKTVSVDKRLNRKQPGELYLPAVAVRLRRINYIPTAVFDAATAARLKTGDYLGLYTDLDGLDVSHVGILIRRQGDLLLRHASSRKGVEQVVDVPLFDYLQGKPGIVVLRAAPL